MNARVSKIHWHVISKVGLPSEGERLNANGAPRQFLVRGEWSIAVGFIFPDASGFDTGESDDAPRAWAVIEDF